MPESSEAAARLESLLLGMGATETRRLSENAHSEVTLALGSLSIHLASDYGSWRANVSLDDGPQFPASFWTAALGGYTTFPEPVVTVEDLDRLSRVLRRLIVAAPLLEPTVRAMGDQYRKAMKERHT